MLNLTKNKPPSQYLNAIKSIKKWDNLPVEVKRSFREHLLIKEQAPFGKNSQCAYCEIEIKLENSSVEHVFPKNPGNGVSPNIKDH